MKLYGYTADAYDEHRPAILKEVTVVVSPEELRVIAKLLADVANEMERSDFDHVHLNDRISTLRDDPQFIVAKAT